MIDSASKTKQFTKKILFTIASNQINLRKKISYAQKNENLTVLNLHRVAPDDRSSWKPMSPEVFREVCIFISKHFDVITFSEIPNLKLNEIKKPKIILSFDDGYKDFIEYAVPILDEMEFKVNQNVIPNCSIQQRPPFNVIVQDWIGRATNEEIRKLDIPNLKLSEDLNNRTKIGMLLSKYFKDLDYENQKVVFSYLRPQFSNYETSEFTKMMTVEEIKQVSQVHEIGMHSMNHENMNMESDHYFATDLENCKSFAKDTFGTSSPVYAFPNGAFREGQVTKVLDFGFSHCLLVGNSYSKVNQNVHSRVNFFADSNAEALTKIAGNVFNRYREVSK
jgi:peptidoglycan/xylan/chitin deacetylase (PgdA/CDA1 family)